MWRILGRGTTDGGLVVGTIIKPKLGLQPKPFGEACYAFWQGGDFIKNAMFLLGLEKRWGRCMLDLCSARSGGSNRMMNQTKA